MMNESITIKELYSLDRTIAASVFDGCIYPWEVLSKIGDYIVELGSTLPEDEYIKKDGNVWIHKEADVFESAYIAGPAIICKGAQIRHCAFIRGKAIGPDENVDTGIKKIGAFLGDYVEVGCGSVLNPGTIVGKESNIYPLSSVRGFVPAGSIYKKQGEITKKH